MSAKKNIPKKSIENEMPNVKNLSELATVFGCGRDSMSHILIDYGLYDTFFDMKFSDSGVKKRKVEPCCICGSTFRAGKYKGEWYCKKHYSQMARGGIRGKTIYDKNDYEFDEDVCRIILRDVKQNIVGYCVIDTEDYSKVNKYKWFKNNHGYCVTKGINPSNNIGIHRVIMDYQPEYYCDHIDNDTLNNRKSNLRIVTPQENAANMSKKNTNTSGVVGVHAYNNDSVPKWEAMITHHYKSIFLGRSTSFDAMVKCRLNGEARYFGVYSNNYNPETNRIELEYFSHDTQTTKFVYVDLPEDSEVENAS